MAGLVKEMWLDRLMMGFYRKGTFLSRMTDWSALTEGATVINLAELGVSPEVLINNNSYPIPMASGNDSPLQIPMDHYETENIAVSSVEQAQRNMKLMDSYLAVLRSVLHQKQADKSIHAVAPTVHDTANHQFILETEATATRDLNRYGLTGTFHKFSFSMIGALQEEFNAKDYPMEGRELVLHPSHEADLRAEDENRYNEIFNKRSGDLPPEIDGFTISRYSKQANYVSSTKAKLPFGTVVTPAADTVASTAYLNSEAMRATGQLGMFHVPKSLNTGNRREEIGMEQWFIALPIRNKSMTAIISKRTA